MSANVHVGDALPSDHLDDPLPWTSLLIRGPSLVAKRHLAIRILAAGNEFGDAMLLVTTKTNARTALSGFERVQPSVDRDRLGLIDCSGSENQERIREVTTESVGSLEDLTGI